LGPKTLNKKNIITIAVFVGIAVAYIVAPLFIPTIHLIQMNVRIIEVNPVDASDVTFTVAVRNISPWPTAFENTHMTATANSLQVQWSMAAYGSETSIISPAFTLLPLSTTEGRYFVKMMSGTRWTGKEFVSISEPIRYIGVTVTGRMRVGLSNWQPITLQCEVKVS